MNIKEGKLNGVLEIQLEPHEDSRGFFMRTYDDKMFGKHGIKNKWLQESHSLSVEKGVIRGMHFQFPPHAEAKLIRVVNGEIYDVFVDLRTGSPTFGQWDSARLSAGNKKMLFLPKGFAHGFCTLTKNCELLYKMDNYYSPENSGAIRWDDPDLDIKWPVKKPTLSEKDSKAESLKKFVSEHGGINI